MKFTKDEVFEEYETVEDEITGRKHDVAYHRSVIKVGEKFYEVMYGASYNYGIEEDVIEGVEVFPRTKTITYYTNKPC